MNHQWMNPEFEKKDKIICTKTTKKFLSLCVFLDKKIFILEALKQVVLLPHDLESCQSRTLLLHVSNIQEKCITFSGKLMLFYLHSWRNCNLQTFPIFWYQILKDMCQTKAGLYLLLNLITYFKETTI